MSWKGGGPSMAEVPTLGPTFASDVPSDFYVRRSVRPLRPTFGPTFGPTFW